MEFFLSTLFVVFGFVLLWAMPSAVDYFCSRFFQKLPTKILQVLARNFFLAVIATGLGCTLLSLFGLPTNSIITAVPRPITCHFDAVTCTSFEPSSSEPGKFVGTDCEVVSGN